MKKDYLSTLPLEILLSIFKKSNFVHSSNSSLSNLEQTILRYSLHEISSSIQLISRKFLEFGRRLKWQDTYLPGCEKTLISFPWLGRFVHDLEIDISSPAIIRSLNRYDEQDLNLAFESVGLTRLNDLIYTFTAVKEMKIVGHPYVLLYVLDRLVTRRLRKIYWWDQDRSSSPIEHLYAKRLVRALSLHTQIDSLHLVHTCNPFFFQCHDLTKLAQLLSLRYLSIKSIPLINLPLLLPFLRVSSVSSLTAMWHEPIHSGFSELSSAFVDTLPVSLRSFTTNLTISKDLTLRLQQNTLVERETNSSHCRFFEK